jgi:hypothetical protein
LVDSSAGFGGWMGVKPDLRDCLAPVQNTLQDKDVVDLSVKVYNRVPRYNILGTDP